MRTLLALTALMLVLAGAVWWKTRPAEDLDNMPPTTISDENVGVATIGKEGSAPVEANYPKKSGSDGGGDHEGPVELDDNNRSGEQSPPDADDLTPPAPPNELEPTPPVAVAITHTIASGDTLYGLVTRAYGTAPQALVDAVAAANNMSDPGALEIGQVVTFPEISGFSAPQKP